jgi:hypothetical protein
MPAGTHRVMVTHSCVCIWLPTMRMQQAELMEPAAGGLTRTGGTMSLLMNARKMHMKCT